ARAARNRASGASMVAAIASTDCAVMWVRRISAASSLVMLVRSSTAIGLFGSAAHASSIPRTRFSVVSVASSDVSSAMGMSQCTASRNSPCLVRDSDLDWTIVRPSILFDLDKVTDYTAGDVPPVGGFTARIDLAHYLTTLIDDAASIGTTPIVSTIEGAPTFWENIKRQSARTS
ncbi:MAG: hypothetical protein QOJ20_210, partial [Mycobacterium sp.]|nr:hypothetical protein [Mycobacterium sp.]